MLSGATPSAAAMAGTAVFRMVVSSDSMKNATATSHGRSRLGEEGRTASRPPGRGGPPSSVLGGHAGGDRRRPTSALAVCQRTALLVEPTPCLEQRLQTAQHP